MGIGVVIRDHLGVVRAACICYVDQVEDPELAEAIVVRHALSFTEEAGFQSIIMASDCSTIVNKVKNVTTDRSQIGAIIYDIKSRALKFKSCMFTHVNRSCNVASHVLARSAEHDPGSCWFNVVPDVIRTIVCTETFDE
ncbi:hypothetical protein VPH35_074951 [Triticum aestivum]